MAFDGFDGVHGPAFTESNRALSPSHVYSDRPAYQQQQVVISEQQHAPISAMIAEQATDFTESFGNSPVEANSSDISSEPASGVDAGHSEPTHRVTSEAKLYHPQPTRLVSNSLASESVAILDAHDGSSYGSGRATVATSTDIEQDDDVSTKDVVTGTASLSLDGETNTQSYHSNAANVNESVVASDFPLTNSDENQEAIIESESNMPKDTPEISPLEECSPPTPSENWNTGEEAFSQSSSIPEESEASRVASSGSKNSFASFKPTPTPGGASNPAPSIYNENNEKMLFYPAPIPIKLRLPPLLSKKGQQREANKRSSRVTLGSGAGIRRRSSQMVRPPTWFINPEEDSTYAPRSPSPALSMDSGRATLEDDENYQFVDADDFEDNGKSKKKRGGLFSRKNRKVSNPHDAFDSDVDEEELSTMMQQQQQHNDDAVAFSHYDPEVLAQERLLSEGGGYVSGTNKPMSLIEELEFRKARRKDQKKRVLQERAMVESSNLVVADDGTTIRSSVHPLDQRWAKSLLELQFEKDLEYVEGNHMRMLVRQKQQHLTAAQPEEEDLHVGETLKERRARLKKEKEMEKLEQDEPLAARRRRLRNQQQLT